MYNKPIKIQSQIHRETTEEGISIEEKVRKALKCGEAIDETAPLIYTERKDGVLPEHDIRTDRQELALEAYDRFNKSDAMKSTETAETQSENNENNDTK